MDLHEGSHLHCTTSNGRVSMKEAVNWVCTWVQQNHEGISEFSLILQENRFPEAMNYDFDVPCIVQ